MLKKIIFTTTLLSSTAIFAQTTQPVFTDNKTPINVKQNQTFTITLQSNPTTGYSWKWDANKFDRNLVSLVNHKYVAPDNKKMIGAPGYEMWTFQAKPGNYRVTQVGHIVMEYQRPWEKMPGAKKTFIVHIK